jgi:hypothetical protein
MQDSSDSTFDDAFLKALLNVSRRVSFGTKSEGPKIEASSFSKLCPEGMANVYHSAPVLRIHLAGLPATLKESHR